MSSSLSINTLDKRRAGAALRGLVSNSGIGGPFVGEGFHLRPEPDDLTRPLRARELTLELVALRVGPEAVVGRSVSALPRVPAGRPTSLPYSAHALDLLRRRFAVVNTSEVSWDEVGDHVKGLSQAGLVRAAESAAKQAILSNSDSLSTADLVTSLGEHRGIQHVLGFGSYGRASGRA
jgi:hypothetical protein